MPEQARSFPLGWRNKGRFVCQNCIDPEDVAGGMGCDARVGSGEVCSRCGDKMPYLARVRILPDGCSSIKAPAFWRKIEKSIRVERETEVLIDSEALVYVSIGCDRELGLRVGPNGKIEVWVHDDPYGDEGEPNARWTYEPEDRR